MDITLPADGAQPFSATASNKFSKSLKWTGLIGLIAFCIYRLAVFTPQPLDSPATLRPTLYRIFNWWLHSHGTPEKAFDSWRNDCFLALFIPPVLAFLYYLRQHEAIRISDRLGTILCSRRLFLGSIAGCLLLCRFPILLQNQLNPDEGEFLYAAHKLFFNGNFFAAVDCHTSGPFNAYSLMLPAIFGISPDYASSRTLGLVTIFLCLYLFYKAFALILPEEIARLAIVPTAAAFCTFNHSDFLHMNSEHIPLLWISIAIYVTVRIFRYPHNYRSGLFLLGLLATAGFFTKIQSIPVLAAITAVAVVYVHFAGYARKLWNPALWVFAGTLPLMAVNAALCSIAGVWRDFWFGYLVSNWTYSFTEGTFATNVALFLSYLFLSEEIRFLLFLCLGYGATLIFHKIWLSRLKDQNVFIQMLLVAGIVISVCIFLRDNLSAQYAYLVYLGIAALIVQLSLYVRRPNVGQDRVRWLGILASVLLAASLYAIYKPHRAFLHYLFFLIPPLSMGMAWMLMKQYEISTAELNGRMRLASQAAPFRRAVASVSVLFTITIAYQSFIWARQSSEVMKAIRPTVRPAEGDFVRSITDPGAQIRVWGWTAGPYLGSGREGEGRDTHVLYCFRPDRLQKYYVDRFLTDMQRRPPDVFIDAIGPASWSLTDRKAFNFEQLKGIAGFVEANYVHLADLYDQRFFLRRDLAARRDALYGKNPLPQKDCDLRAMRCLTTSITLPNDLKPVDIPEHALVQAEFIPVQPQIGPATVLNNEAIPNSYRGFRFQHTTGDRYVLFVGAWDRWVVSKEFILPVGKPVSLNIEFNGDTVKVQCNNEQSDILRLPHVFANSPGAINLNSWIGGADPFAGKMQFFQVVDLQKQQQGRAPLVRKKNSKRTGAEPAPKVHA